MAITLQSDSFFTLKTEVPGKLTIPSLVPFFGPDLGTDAKNYPVRVVKI